MKKNMRGLMGPEFDVDNLLREWEVDIGILEGKKGGESLTHKSSPPIGMIAKLKVKMKKAREQISTRNKQKKESQMTLDNPLHIHVEIRR